MENEENIMISFRSYGEELDKIESGELKQIIRQVDSWNPVFKEIEEGNLRRLSGYPKHIWIRDESNQLIGSAKKIKKVSYKDGNVIIDWE